MIALFALSQIHFDRICDVVNNGDSATSAQDVRLNC